MMIRLKGTPFEKLAIVYLRLMPRGG